MANRVKQGEPSVGYAPQQGGQPVMTGQPGQQGQVMWMERPLAIPGCPPGLEYLSALDQILIHQQVELFEALTDIEMKNRYQMKNSLGQQFAFAKEESDTCMRICCGPARGFLLHITDNLGQEIMMIRREFKCCAGCCWCIGCCNSCSLEIYIESPPGNVIGSVKQQGSAWKAVYGVFNENDDEIFKILGPCCICECPCASVDFKIHAPNDETQVVGTISRQWSGLMKEMFTTADNFGVQFPMDLDVKMKAVLIGATFLIDFMFFENKNN